MPVVADQYDILPDVRPEATLQHIPVERITYPSSEATIDPSDEFIASIANMGVLVPIAVVRVGRAGFRVAAGRRRLIAASRLQMETIPAMVFPANTPIRMAAAISIVENHHRSPNPLSDLEAIEALVQQGYGVDQIADALGMRVSMVRSRMRLAGMVPSARDAMREGRLSIALAGHVARWAPHVQSDFMAQTMGRRVTIGDVREIARRQGPLAGFSTETVDAMSGEAMGVPLLEADRAYYAGEELTILLPSGVPLTLHPLVFRGQQYLPREHFGDTFQQVTRQVGIDELSPSWDSVILLLDRIDELMPMTPDDDTDRFYVELTTMREAARRQAQAESAGRSVHSGPILGIDMGAASSTATVAFRPSGSNDIG